MGRNVGVACACIVVGALATGGCAGSEEEAVSRFLEATRDGDLGTLAEVSIVPLPGTVESWRIVGRVGERSQPFSLAQLRAAAREHAQASGPRDAAFAERTEGLRRDITRHRRAARASVDTWADIAELEGSVHTREVEISVRADDVETDYVLTLKRFDLAHRDGGDRQPSRWIVYDAAPR